VLDRSIVTRAGSKATRELKRASLEVRRRRCSGDLFVDYGWIRLLYSGDSDDQEIAYHLNQNRWHEKDMHVFRSLLAPGRTAIDVGANLGFISTQLAAVVGDHGRVLAFEPSPRVFAKLEKTIVANGLHQVEPFNLGCGAAASVEKLHRISDSSGNASIVGVGTDPIEIRIERLDDIPEARVAPVSLIKIDTEGYEPRVLEGAAGLIEADRPIIYLEMGGEYIESTLQSIQILEDAGYDIDHVRTMDWSSVGNGSDYFFRPRT
jgi:FkbM family methyltransferase